MANGYAGKILRVNLTTQTISTIPTARYEEWGGGYGMGAALFWDLCEDKTVGGRDPKNVVCIMTSPLTGTLAPATGRVEVVGNGLQAHPTDWFNRANFGGRWGIMLKMAGWDGIVVEGKANSLCWIKIVNDKVTIEDAKGLKGMDAWDTQMELWNQWQGTVAPGQWQAAGDGFSTQRPAVLAIAAAGEAGSRTAALIHDAGNGAGTGGFGGVFGSKNLKAISVIGSGGIEVSDPAALMEGRLWMKENIKPSVPGPATNPTYRMSGCGSCLVPCRQRSIQNTNNDSQCVDTYWYAARCLYSNPSFPAADAKRATDYCQRYGINAIEAIGSHQYVKMLFDMGVLGKGKQVNSAPLAMESYGTLGFAEEFMRAITSQQGIGAALSEGAPRFAESIGRLEEDLDSGILNYPYHGYFFHFTLPGIEWTYGSLLGERDINEHSFQKTFGPLYSQKGLADSVPADKLVNIFAEKMKPFTGDPMFADYSDAGLYTGAKAKFIQWDRHYCRFWKQSALYCDQTHMFPSFIEGSKMKIGFTPDAEPIFWNAVTGQNLSFEDGMEIGRKIWFLSNAIWALQGRHRDKLQLAGFMYKPGAAYGGCGTTKSKVYVVGPAPSNTYPVYENGKWSYNDRKEIYLDRQGVEEFKTHYYLAEGWDPNTGIPTRNALAGVGLGHVADELQAKGKLTA